MKSCASMETNSKFKVNKWFHYNIFTDSRPLYSSIIENQFLPPKIMIKKKNISLQRNQCNIKGLKIQKKKKNKKLLYLIQSIYLGLESQYTIISEQISTNSKI